MISCSPRDKHGGAEHRHLDQSGEPVRRGKRSLIRSVRCAAKEETSGTLCDRQGSTAARLPNGSGSTSLPDRNASAPKTSSPRYFEEFLSRRWAEGCVRGRQLFHEVKARGYTGSFSNLERLLAKWRRPAGKVMRPAPTIGPVRVFDPATGRLISPIIAAALCVKPRGLLTNNQAAKVDALKSEWREFATMRGLAMRFRGILRRGSNLGNSLLDWIDRRYSVSLIFSERALA